MTDTPAKPPPTTIRAHARSVASRSVERFRPFCSKRCADVDLNRWLTGSYAIPAEEEDEGLGAEKE
jgi:endogenous inhibitor of DNA gyrase (YacG/DUF329 family)